MKKRLKHVAGEGRQRRQRIAHAFAFSSVRLKLADCLARSLFAGDAVQLVSSVGWAGLLAA